jgi:hypothetical protein
MNKQILLIKTDNNDDFEIEKIAIKRDFPDAEISQFAVSSSDKFIQVYSVLKETKKKRFENTVIIFRFRLFSNINYFFAFILCLFGFIKHPIFLQKNGMLFSRWSMMTESVLLPLAPFFVLFNLLKYFYQQIIHNFILTPEDKKDEFVGFGKGRKIGGIIYWLIFSHKIKRFGLFGLVHDNYWGMPLGIHSWPVSIFALQKLGFRRLTYLSFLLLTTGIIWLGLLTGQSWLLLLIPILLFSNYIVFNIFVGTWELFSWSWGMLAFCAFQAQLPELAGVFFALTLLSHPGVSSLVGLIIGVFAIIFYGPFFSLLFLVRMGLTALLLSIWWIIPYYRSRQFLGRTNNQNNHWQKSRPWSVSAACQLLFFLIFALVAMFAAGKPILSLLLLIPPFIVYYNIKINWIYSQYTTMNFFFMIGLIFLMNYPTPVGWFLFIYILFTSVKLIWGIGMDPYKGYDLKPLTLGSRKNQIVEAFASVKGRVGFEMELSMETGGWRYSPAIGYMLAATDHDLVNVAYSQIGDSRIIEKYCQYFNHTSSIETFHKACEDCGVNYMTALSDEFRKYLEEVGAEKVSEVNDQYLTDSPEDMPVKIAIYKLPWEARLISEPVTLTIEPNRMRFDALAGITYQLKYSAFPGWRAFQNGKRIQIRDANPGIEVTAGGDGEIELRYSLQNNWTR